MDREMHPSQQRRFFALCNILGYDPDVAKERAKKTFKVEHFNYLTVEQAAVLIEKLERQMERTLIKCPNCRGTGYVKKETLENE